MQFQDRSFATGNAVSAYTAAFIQVLIFTEAGK